MVGSPFQGRRPTYSVDTSLGTSIPRYAVVQHSTSTSDFMTAGLCNTGTTNRSLGFGVAYRAFPFSPQIWEGVPTPDNIGYETYDPAKKNKVTVQEEGNTWILVKIVSGGNDVNITPGDPLVPSYDTPGGIISFDDAISQQTASLTATYDLSVMTINLQERDNVMAVSKSPIFIPASGSGFKPTAQGVADGTWVSTLTALTNAVTYGYVFGKLNGK